MTGSGRPHPCTSPRSGELGAGSGMNRCTLSILPLLVILAAASCVRSASVSSTPPPGMDISGEYVWHDAFDVYTGCTVRIFWQDEEYHGWVETDEGYVDTCPWRGYELRRVEFQGGQVRLTVACPRSGCPYAVRQGRAGGAEYLLDIAPAFFIAGHIIRGSPDWSNSPRWARMKLVPRGAEQPRPSNNPGAGSREQGAEPPHTT